MMLIWIVAGTVIFYSCRGIRMRLGWGPKRRTRAVGFTGRIGTGVHPDVQREYDAYEKRTGRKQGP